MDISSERVTRKPQLKINENLLLVKAPSCYRESLGMLPDGVKLSSEPNGETDVISGLRYFKRRTGEAVGTIET